MHFLICLCKHIYTSVKTESHINLICVSLYVVIQFVIKRTRSVESEMLRMKMYYMYTIYTLQMLSKSWKQLELEITFRRFFFTFDLSIFSTSFIMCDVLNLLSSKWQAQFRCFVYQLTHLKYFKVWATFSLECDNIESYQIN